jgi:hypothetical protein
MQLLTAALWFAVLPSVYVVSRLNACAVRRLGTSWRVAALAAGLGLAAIAADPNSARAGLLRWATTAPLRIGLSAVRQEVIEVIKSETTTDARILVEDPPSYIANPRWTVLLPLLTERDFIGGLAPDGCIEHAYSGFLEQALLGRPISLWTDSELDQYCGRYNVGWIVAWSPAAVQRFRTWQGEGITLPRHAGLNAYLFPVRRSFNYVLRGKARVLSWSRERIALADVVPDEDGVVVLSLHYQTGMQASPPRIQVEREPDPFDLVPFLRLRVPEPTALVTLTWQPER